jgi:cytochrome c biogenesis protein CcmG/thiol:disulfide interchange protein DsbE
MLRSRSPAVIAVASAVVALMALMIYGVIQNAPDRSIDRAVAEGRRRPATVRTVNELFVHRPTSLTALRGKVVVLNFWASWCDPCRGESPALERAEQKFDGKGLTVIGADVDDLTSDAHRFASQYKLTYQMWRYPSDFAAKDFGVKALPETFVIDRAGRVARLQRGPLDDKWLNRELPPILAEAG